MAAADAPTLREIVHQDDRTFPDLEIKHGTGNLGIVVFNLLSILQMSPAHSFLFSLYLADDNIAFCGFLGSFDYGNSVVHELI